jgi:hypothetical protein
VAIRPGKPIIFNGKMEVIRRVKDEHSCPTICRDLHITPSTVITILKNVEKIKMTMGTPRRKILLQNESDISPYI